MTRTSALLALTLVAAGCAASGGDPFTELVDSGASCSELFDHRNSVDPDDDRIPGWNQQLRDIGCHSSGSTRTD